MIGTKAVFTLGAYVRRDQYNYYPSDNPLADFGPINSETIAQDRNLTNAGVRSDISYVKGAHNVKAGVTYQHTFLNENDRLGIIDPSLLPSLTDASGAPCFVGGVALDAPCTTLLPVDLTRGGGLFTFRGHADVKELSLYLQDTITKGNWSFNLGIRGDVYNGLSAASQAEPRVGAGVQHQAEQYGAAAFVCANAGDAVQREPHHCHDGMQRGRDCGVDSLRAGKFSRRAAE